MNFPTKIILFFESFYAYVMTELDKRGVDTKKPVKLVIGGEQVPKGWEFVIIADISSVQKHPTDDNELTLGSGMIFDSREGVKAMAVAFNYWIMAMNVANGAPVTKVDTKASTVNNIIQFPKNNGGKTFH